MIKGLILPQAHVTQITQHGVPGDWVVKNNTGDILHRFDSKYTDSDIFDIMSFAKKYELHGYRLGEHTAKQYSKINELNLVIKSLTEHNNLLSTKLHELLEG